MFNVDGSTEVSFINSNDGQTDFWSIEPNGDYALDCQRGRDAASELQRAMFFGSSPILLGSVARAIASKNRWTGVEVGFFHAMGEALLCSPHEVIGLTTNS